jgi:hypothetical protein
VKGVPPNVKVIVHFVSNRDRFEASLETTLCGLSWPPHLWPPNEGWISVPSSTGAAANVRDACTACLAGHINKRGGAS